MKEINSIVRFSKEVKIKADSSIYPKNDVRIDFLNLIGNLTHQFHLEKIALELSDFFVDGKLLCIDSEIFHNQINDFVELAKNDVLYKSFQNSINRGLIIDSWSSFEVCLSSICNEILSAEDKHNIQSKKYESVLKCLKKYNLDGDTKNKLEKMLVEKEFWLTSTNNKFTKLFSMLKAKSKYRRNIDEDRVFLEFFGKLRNTMHSNFVYFGNNEEPYIFENAEFKFDKGHLVVHERESDPFLILKLIVRLTEIYIEIISHFDDIEFIPYPDQNAEKY